MSPSAKRGGPATTSGKAISRLNATKHGALSEVIPDHEVEAYSAHLDLIHMHYDPEGYLEDVLTDRVANLLWRIGRVARYEQAVIKRQVEVALNRDGIHSIDDLLQDLAELLRRVDPDAEEHIRDTRRYLEQTVALASLPSGLVEKIPRYEAHLDRALTRTMAQLRELQRERQQFVPQKRIGEP